MYPRIFLILLFFTASPVLFAQNKPWRTIRMDNNFIVQVPEGYRLIDTILPGDKPTPIRVIAASAGGLNIQFSVMKGVGGEMIRDNPHDSIEARQGFESGAREKADRKGYACSFADTVINNLSWIRMKISGPGIAVNSYSFFNDDNSYMITVTEKPDSLNPGELRHFFNGIRFTGVRSTPKHTDSQSERLGYFMGQLLATLLIAGIVIGLFFYFGRKKKRAAKENS